jgi:small subunit ribosomal protein S21
LALHRNVALSRRSFYCPNIGDLRQTGASGGPDRFDEQETTRRMQIIVRDNNVDQALRALKKKLQREGVYREMKLRRHYEKPSEKRARERAAAVRRARKMERKRMERDGIK